MSELINSEETPVAEEPAEAPAEEIQSKLELWIDDHIAELELAQLLAKYILEIQLVNTERVLPFQIIPEGEDFVIGVHLDHPVFEHFWLKILSIDQIKFEPWVEYWTEDNIVSTFEDARKLIDNIKNDDLTNFNGCNEDIVHERRLFEKIKQSLKSFGLKQVNLSIEKILKNYRDTIDPLLKDLKHDIDFLEDVWITNADDGTTIPIGRLSGNYTQFLLHNPCLLSVRDKSGLILLKERTQTSILDKIQAFMDVETKRSALLYDIQILCANSGFTVEVSNDNYLEGKRGKFVQVSEDGAIELKHVLMAQYIKVHSKFEINQ